MSILLRDALEESMKGWKPAMPAAWRRIFENVELNAAGVNRAFKHDPWIPIFPVIHSHKDANTRILGSPYEAHTFRAFQQLAPSKVRVVIVGQDPYPDVAKATGQAFEQGNLRHWTRDAGLVSKSLQRVLQCAAAEATGRDRYYRSTSKGWSRFLADLEDKKLKLADPKKLFAGYKKQGVLWLNTTLTISLFRSKVKIRRGTRNVVESHQEGHADYWEPFVDALFDYLVSRGGNKHVVFSLWGGWATKFEQQIKAASAPGARVATGTTRHPVMDNFLTDANPMTTINKALDGFGDTPINWLPTG